MVLFLKRIPSPIGIWNAEYSRHRNKGYWVIFFGYCSRKLPLLMMSSIRSPPSPLSSYVIILQTPLPSWRWRTMWMPPYGFARTTDTIREKNSILFKKGKNMLKSNSDVSGSTSLVCNAVFFLFFVKSKTDFMMTETSLKISVYRMYNFSKWDEKV